MSNRRISPTQISTFEDCNRHWWLQRIARLPGPPQAAHLTIGTVLHAVCERWLSATVTGRVPSDIDYVKQGVTPWLYNSGTDTWVGGPLEGQRFGQPVNLYPEGWETITERDGQVSTVTPTEAKLIKRLVAEAIETGILRRSEGVVVERNFELPLIPGVNIVGKIDVYRPPSAAAPTPVIEDHKTYGKSSGRFLKRDNSDSPNYLGKDQQVKTYAWATAQEDGAKGMSVVVRHNQFPKFPGAKVTSVEAPIDAEDIYEHGEYLKDVATRMKRAAATKKWDDVPGPEDTGKCERWYGKPCPFHKICGRAETIEAYTARAARLLAEQGTSPRLDLPLPKPRKRTRAKEATGMSIFDSAKKAKAARSERTAKAGTKEAEAAVNGGAPAAKEPGATNGAPWANPKCPACKGRGMASKGGPCPICDAKAKRDGRPTSMSYVVETDDEGLGVAVAREEAVEALEEAGQPLEWYEGAEPEAAPAPEPEPQPEPAPKPARKARKKKAPQVESEPEPQRAAAQEQPEAPAPKARAAAKAKGAGRPSVGLTILVGATPMKGAIASRPIVTSAEVLARFGAELAADMNSDHYYTLDSFKRRDRLAQKADYIVGELARHVLVHPGILGNDDAGTLVQALMGVSEGLDAVIVRTS